MMKKNGKNSKFQFFQNTISTILVLSLVTLGTPLAGIAQGTPNQSFTGEEVFRGIMFGQAPVAQLFPEIWSSDDVAEQLNTKEKVKAWDALTESVVSQIKTADPTFMDRFGQEMQSGDHLRIQNGMIEASEKMFNAMTAIGVMNENGEFSSTYEGPLACSVVAVCAAAIAVAVWKWVAVVDIAAVAMVAAVVLAVWRWGPSVQSEATESQKASARLFQESFIAAIAQKLDASN